MDILKKIVSFVVSLVLLFVGNPWRLLATTVSATIISILIFPLETREFCNDIFSIAEIIVRGVLTAALMIFAARLIFCACFGKKKKEH